MKALRVVGGSLMVVGLAAASLGVSGVAEASSPHAVPASSTPPGNNGTIKIDDVPLVDVGQPDLHANHPHVSCTLALAFFGFDATTNDATVTFDAQPPSGTGPVAVTEGPTAFTFTGYGPGGSLDYSTAYELDVSGLTANPQQGYHIKVTVDVSNPGSVSAADEKYKVFWYEPCGAPLTTTTVPFTTTTTAPSLGFGQGTTTTTTVPRVTTTTTPRVTTTTTPRVTTTTTPKVAAGQGATTTTPAPPTVASRPASSGVTGQQVALGAASSGVPRTAVGSSAAQSVPSAEAPAASPAEQLPAGAGTDLGFFRPASWARSAGPSWDLLIAGGLLMLLTGGIITRRK